METIFLIKRNIIISIFLLKENMRCKNK